MSLKTLLIIIVIALAVWIYKNPIGRVGMVRDNLIVYSGIPVLNADLVIRPDGSFLMDNQTREQIRYTSAVRDIQIDRLKTYGPYNVVIIGRGTGENLYPVAPDLISNLARDNAQVFQGNTFEMAKKYNELKSQGKQILAIFVLGSPPSN